MVGRVPELVLICRMDPAEPPCDHGAGAVGHVSRGCDVGYAIAVEGPASFHAVVGCGQEQLGVLEPEGKYLLVA